MNSPAVELRTRTEDHVRIHFRKMQIPEFKALFPQEATTTNQAIALFHRTLEPDSTTFGKVIYVDEQYVGDVWCTALRRGEDAAVNICIFDTRFWDRGIGTQALNLFISEIAELFSLKAVTAVAYTHNWPILEVLRKTGFEIVEVSPEIGLEAIYFHRSLTSE